MALRWCESHYVRCISGFFSCSSLLRDMKTEWCTLFLGTQNKNHLLCSPLNIYIAVKMYHIEFVDKISR